jgi:hypothetical protein
VLRLLLGSLIAQTYKSGGTPKGTINPAGYTISETPESSLQEKLEVLAKKLGAFLLCVSFSCVIVCMSTYNILTCRRRHFSLFQEDSPAEHDRTPEGSPPRLACGTVLD